MSKRYPYITVAVLALVAVTVSSCGCNKTSQLLEWRENGALGSTVESVQDTLSADLTQN